MDEAFSLEELRKPLRGYCYRMLGGSADAEDAVQEAMLRAIRHAGRFDADPGQQRTAAPGQHAENPLSPPIRWMETDEAQRLLLEGYVHAFERHDVDALKIVLRADAINSMPPYPWWVQGP